ncbi:unnamed protein product, partial [Staurois parvus]
SWTPALGVGIFFLVYSSFLCFFFFCLFLQFIFTKIIAFAFLCVLWETRYSECRVRGDQI